MVNVRRGGTITREAFVFTLGHDKLITLQLVRHFTVFDQAIARTRRTRPLRRRRSAPRPR